MTRLRTGRSFCWRIVNWQRSTVIWEGVRAVRRFVPPEGLLLDVAAGACDIGDRLVASGFWQVVALDLNPSGLSRAKRSKPVVGDALSLPFGDKHVRLRDGIAFLSSSLRRRLRARSSRDGFGSPAAG